MRCCFVQYLVPAMLGAMLVMCAGGCRPGASALPLTEELAAGWARFRVDDFDVAARHFKRAAEHPGGDNSQHAEALYGLASMFNYRRPGADQTRARELYEEAAKRYPETDGAAWSLLALARLEHLTQWGVAGDIPGVQAAYQRVIDRFPMHLAGEEAFLYQQSNILVTLDAKVVGRAAPAMKGFIRTHTQSPYRCIAYHVLSACYAEMGEQVKRLKSKEMALQAIVDDGVTPVELEEMIVTWLVAFDAQKEVGDFEMARMYYRRIIERWRGSAYVFAANHALESMDQVEEEIRNELRARHAKCPPEQAQPQEAGS